ncbi:MAG: hypothetical protein RL692_752 [Planctomycetota bacterium]|jgi:hypothetical protein
MPRGFPSFFMSQVAAIATFAFFMGGCSNQFLTTYQGERFEATTSPTVVIARPANSGLIGSSDFVSAAGFGEPEAVSAARAVGADSVQWSRGLDNRDATAGAGVVKSSLSPTGPVSSWASVQPGGFVYRYVARYYKSGVKDFAPAVESAPQFPANGAGQIIEDDQAATQKAAGR